MKATITTRCPNPVAVEALRVLADSWRCDYERETQEPHFETFRHARETMHGESVREHLKGAQ